jgi:hypothetical protein
VTGDWIQVQNSGSGSIDVLFTGNTLSDNHSNTVAGGAVAVFGVTGAPGSSLTYNISNNTFRDSTGTALAVSGGNAGNSSSGSITNNVIGVQGVANSGSTAASGIAFVISGGGTHNALISRNTIQQHNNHGILVQVGQNLGNATDVSITVSNNTVRNPGNINTDFNGIHLNNGTVLGESYTTTFHMFGNNIEGSGTGPTSPNNLDFRLRQRQNTTVELPGYTGSMADTAAVVAFLQAQNNMNGGAAPSGAASTTVGSGGGGFVNGAVPPAPLMARMQGEAPAASVNITDFNLTPLIAAAIARWAEAGATDEQLAAMRAVSVSVGDLGGLQIGQSTTGAIVIDDDAGGWGWFVDPTPGDDAEFSGSGEALGAVAGGGAEGRMDLLTALMHELGHQVGLDDHYADAGEGLMYGFLDFGERRLPELDHVTELAAASGPGPSVGVTGWATGMVPDTAGLETTGPSNGMAFAPASLLMPEPGVAGVEGWVTGLVLESETEGLDALLSGFGPSAQDGGWDAGPVAVDPWSPPPSPFDPIHPVM